MDGKIKLIQRGVSVLFLFLLVDSALYSQLKSSIDIYSRYIWRGNDFGNAPSYQPAISYSTGNLSLGVWGAFSSVGSFSENDLWASYSIETSTGTIVVSYTDYFFPSAGIKIFNYKGNGNGAHTLEIGLGYIGTDSFPILINGYYNFHNDIDNSSYLQFGYPFFIDSTYSINVFTGFSGRASTWYGNAKTSLINLGFTVSKRLKITDNFSLPVYSSYIINPEKEQSWLIFGLGL